MGIGNFIFGDPLKTENLASERLSKTKALAIFSSDVLSSTAYATDGILLALGAALTFSCAMPLVAMIALLTVVVSVSYWQTIEAYPLGGGAFLVAHENLGEFFGLIAASALLVDYILTVAVSLAAGASAIVSAFPLFAKHTVSFCLICLVLLTISNLRGARESANILSIPTYCFIFLMVVLVISGLCTNDEGIVLQSARKIPADMPTFLVIIIFLRAFSSGCSVLTGIETIAGGVTAFKKPQYKNAQITLCIMSVILIFLFMGVTFLARKFGIAFSASETAISQIAKNVFGTGFMYYAIQLMTAAILFLAANTSFAGFPRLASMLAEKKYIPTNFANLGDRLAYSNGIILLAIFSTCLIVTFKGNTHALIPLYSMGVFISFSLSQAGMVKRWFRVRGENWRLKALINTIGTLATSFTLLIIIQSKFLQGAWIIMILVPIIFCAFKKINRRYKEINIELDIKRGGLGALLRPISEARPKVVVPVSRIHKATLAALRFAASLSDDVVAVVVDMDQKEVDRLKMNWRSLNFSMPLIVLRSPYRSVVNPFLDFLTEQDERDPERGKAIVVMPSFIPGKIWQNILHNQTAAIFKTALLYRKQKSEQTRIIVEIPYQMRM
ncbi:MAG: APC family permease [Holosporaceae bacterium]|jgi:amino acid transporter|nr:APC family permease [Holosporaceae bacterium]